MRARGDSLTCILSVHLVQLTLPGKSTEMSPQFSFWHRPHSDNKFASWPEPPVVQPVPVSFIISENIPKLAAQKVTTGTKPYPKSIIIGLGETGESVLRQWLGQLRPDLAGLREFVRVLLITHRDGDSFPEDCSFAQRRSLNSSATNSTRVQFISSPREEIRSIFRLATNVSWFQEWLSCCIQDFVGEIRVFLVASLAESEISVLGDVLQLLRSRPSDPFLNICALLSTETPQSTEALAVELRFAALREASRMATGGIHIVEPLQGSSQKVIRSKLLDHIFLIGPGSELRDSSILRNIPFEQGVGQAMAEALFAFIHPCAKDMWDDVHTIEQPDQAVVHSLGIATLNMPEKAIQNYVAARLAYAVLYGERTDRRAEGIFSRGLPGLDYSQGARWLATEWLTKEFYAHPLFEWLLSISNRDAFRSIPQLSIDFDAVFQAQLAHGLTKLLNRSMEGDSLQKAWAVLEWLLNYLAEREAWFNATSPAKPGAPDRLILQELFSRWLVTLRSLRNQVETWQSVLELDSKQPEPVDQGTSYSWRELAKTSPAVGDWRTSAITKKTDWRSGAQPGHISRKEATTSGIHPGDCLVTYRLLAEEELTNAAGGGVRRSLLSDDKGSLLEAENYYADTIRPELSQHGMSDSDAFKRVRQRLGWWVNLVPGHQPELLLICLPPELSGLVIPEEARFTAQDMAKFVDKLLEIARVQASGFKSDFSGPWFQKQIGKHVNYLRNASSPSLAHDRGGGGERLFYLISRDQTLSGKYREVVFMNLPHGKVKEITGGDASRFTALTLWPNIPLRNITAFQSVMATHHHRKQLYLYPQERAAAQYETIIRGMGEGAIIFPPKIALALANQQLATLFCQALFSGLISPQRKDPGGSWKWTLAEVLDFEPLPLGPFEPTSKSLWDAFQKFSLEFPHELGIEDEINPALHFGSRRQDFLRALHEKARYMREQSKYPQCDDRIKTMIDQWRMGGNDDFTRALGAILAVELDEPVWEGWRATT